MENKPMNNRHKAFADEYLANGLNATQAYLKVYKSKVTTAEVNGHKLLSNTKIKDYIEEQQEITRNELSISKNEILLNVKGVMDNNLEESPGMALKAVEILNKMLGYNETEKKEITINAEQPLFAPLEEEDEDELEDE